MYPTPPSGPDQPYGQGQQPQPPHQGGYGYPQPPAAQGPGPGHVPGPGPGGPVQPYGAPRGPVPPPPPRYQGPGAPDKLPGEGQVVRVLMFIGGTLALLIGMLGVYTLFNVLLLELSGYDDSPDISSPALPIPGGQITVMGTLPLIYGVASVWIASVMKRRKPGVYKAVISFNIASMVTLVLYFLLALDVTVVVPLIFHAGMTGMLFTAKIKAYYGYQAPRPGR